MYLYFTCKYNFHLSHHLQLIKEFLHLVISHLPVVRTVIGIEITIKNFMLWFHYLCQMSYNNHELWYSQACVNMHHNRDHEVSTEICNSKLNFHKHLRIQARTQLHERMTGALALSETKISVSLTSTSAYSCITHCLPLFAQLKLELREGDGTNPTSFKVSRKALVPPLCDSSLQATTQLHGWQREASVSTASLLSGRGMLVSMHKISTQSCRVLVLAEPVTLLCSLGPTALPWRKKCSQLDHHFSLRIKNR